MKKYLTFLMTAALMGFTSCSDDNDERERLLGTGILQSVAPNTLYDPGRLCRFLGDNSLTANLYSQQNNCDLFSGSGTWEKTGASSYTFYFPEISELSGTVTFPGGEQMIFTSEDAIVFTFKLQL